MSEDVAAPVGGPPVEAPPAAAANETAELAPIVEVGPDPASPFGEIGDSPIGAPLGAPDHLLRGSASVEEAFHRMEARNPRYGTYGELIDAHDARRRDHSERLMNWLEGNA